jgi:hypothetical protein
MTMRAQPVKVSGTKVTADGTVLGTYKACRRCKGTGWWGGEILRGCFGCGGRNGVPGSGRVFVENAAGKIARLEAHAAEVRAEIERETAYLPRARFGRKQLEQRIEASRANLARIEGEIADARAAL